MRAWLNDHPFLPWMIGGYIVAVGIFWLMHRPGNTAYILVMGVLLAPALAISGMILAGLLLDMRSARRHRKSQSSINSRNSSVG